MFKGTMSQNFFVSGFMSSSPRAPIMMFGNFEFFENSRSYLQVTVHHRCQRQRWSHLSCISDDGDGKFTTGVNSRMPHNSMNAKKRRNHIHERQPTSVVTLGVEWLLFTTAGPEQQQKNQQQHDVTTEETPATQKHQDQNRCQQQQDLSNIRTLTTALSAKNRKGRQPFRDVNNKRYTKNSRNTKKRQDVSNSRNRGKANNSIILNTAGKSATERRQATAGNSGVVDTGGKFATSVIDTGGKSVAEYLPLVSMTPTVNLPPVSLHDTGGK